MVPSKFPTAQDLDAVDLIELTRLITATVTCRDQLAYFPDGLPWQDDHSSINLIQAGKAGIDCLPQLDFCISHTPVFGCSLLATAHNIFL